MAMRALCSTVLAGVLGLTLGGLPALADEPGDAATVTADAATVTTQSDPGDTVVHTSLEEALSIDLGMSMEEFVAAGVQAEQASPILEAASTTDNPEEPVVGILTAEGIEPLEPSTLPGGDSFADLDALRQAYLSEVGPEGLTGVAYTLEGYEVMVVDPDVARERGRADTSTPVQSPQEWAAAYPGVSVVGTTGPEVAASLRGGDAISYGGVGCSHGFNGWYQGNPVGIGAGHCRFMGGSSISAGGRYVGEVNWWQFGAPGSAVESWGTDLSTYTQGSNFSYPASIKTGSTSLTVTGRANAVLGLPVCKSGRMTGWTCTKINKIGWQWIGDGSGDINKPKRWVWSLFADHRIIPGDSGGPWVAGHKGVGVTSSYDAYANGDPYSTASLLTSFDDYRPGVAVKMWLGTPSIKGAERVGDRTYRARWNNGSTVSGTLSRLSGDSISPGTVIDVSVDGTRVLSAPVASNGAFSFTWTGSGSRSNKVVLRPRSGYSTGTSITVTDYPDGAYPTVTRRSGSNRYATAAAIATAHYSPGISTVYVTSGANFPDALSAAAVAGKEAMPVLLTAPDNLSAATRSALAELRPGRIVIVGGGGAVSLKVRNQLSGYAPTTRVTGEDRYAVSAAMASGYAAGQRRVYITSGEAFPDALSASAVAGTQDAPLMLTRRDRLPSAVRGQLQRLRPSEIVVVGGTGAVSAGVEAELRGLAMTVTRVSGSDRYVVSAELSRRFASPAPSAWVVRGDDFPDALAAAAVAAKANGPVLLTRPTSLPAAVRTALLRVKPAKIFIAGGTGSVSSGVQRDLRWLTYQ
ncbi:cell wall-binding repeat-containing protein [Ornithinimicrobium sp. Y1847]|uniref:cell wall-binding repeat-containing protein n=1 Tax=Ornithinimicrobium sp. Y1847 TaxID=3405419 RepID=UPI003B6712C5